MSSTEQTDFGWPSSNANHAELSKGEQAERLRLIAACLVTAKDELDAALAHLEELQP